MARVAIVFTGCCGSIPREHPARGRDLGGDVVPHAEVAGLMLDAVPEGFDSEAVKAYLGALPAWSRFTICTSGDEHDRNGAHAHVVMPGNSCKPTFLADVCAKLHEKFDIDHATLQIDHEEAPTPCSLAPDEVV